MGDLGGASIGRALQKNKCCVTNVQLFDTEVKDECAKEMAQAMVSNKQITQVNLGWNTFSPKYQTQINKLKHDNIVKAREDECPQQYIEIEKLTKANAEIHEVKAKIQKAAVKKELIQGKFKTLDEKNDALNRELNAKYQVVQAQSNSLRFELMELDRVEN